MKDYSKSAFPIIYKKYIDGYPNGHHETVIEKGITTRDYFAAKAMQGMMVEFVKQGYPENSNCNELKWMVNASFLIADAMLIRREE